MRAEEFAAPFRMGKLERTGQVVRILRRDEKGDWLIDTEPHKRNSMGVKWIDADTRWTWIRDFKNLEEIFDRPVKSEPAAHQSRSRFKTKAGEHNLEVFFKNTAKGLEINFSVDGRGFALEKDKGKPGSTQTLMSAINVILARLPEAVAYYKPKRVWYKSIGTDTSRAKLYDRLLPLLQRVLGPEWRASTEHPPGWNLYYLDRQQNLKEARIPRAIEQFLDSLNPDDCGVEDIGAYRIHFEGFTSDCKSSADYRRDPEAVYQQVYQDFIQREGGARPLVQDMVGDEDFPILYSIFRKRQPIQEAQQATAKQVLAYINKTHHEPMTDKLARAVLAHPQWELVQVPLLNLNIPDQEYDDVDYDDDEPESDPYGRVMMVEPGHAGEVSAHLVDRKPIVIDADRYIIDGNHRAWAAKYLLNRDYIQAWRPVAQVNEVNYPDELTVSDRIQEYFFQRGYELAGEGRDQMAFESPRGTIVKVLGTGDPEREQIVKNYVRFFEQNQRNPFYPRIYNSGNFTVDGETYFVYEMERVNYVANEEATLDYIEKLMSAVDRGQGPEFVKQNPVPDEIGQQQLAGLLQATEHMIQALGGQAPLDLSAVENLGRRNNGHLVIVDPYSL